MESYNIGEMSIVKNTILMFSLYSIVGVEAGSLSANLDDNGKQHLCPSLQIVIPMSTLSETALHWGKN